MTNQSPHDPPAEDPQAIEFKAVAPGPGDAWRSGDPEPDPMDAGTPAPVGLEIKWFDEDRPPEAGHLFAEAPPEPPLQPFEILHEPRPAVKKNELASEAATPEKGKNMREAPSPRPPLWERFIWGLMPVILLLAGYGSVILTQRGIGHAWDEAYYYEPSMSAADWLIKVVRGEKPFSKAEIDRSWEGIHEHPSIQKILSGIAIRSFPDPKNHLWAMRLPIAILFGLTLSLIYVLGRRAWGPVPGLIAALLYLTMPRIFGHAHFASMETPLNFMMLLVVFCFLRGLDYPLWSALTGVTFGLLLATKLNAFFLPIPLILWAHLYARHRYVNNLFAMLTLGPLVFVLAWPWLWPDPAMRLLQYLAFHAQHQQTAVFFMGQKWGYGNINAPWFYPVVILGVTLPLTALLLGGLGVVRTLLALTRRPIGALYLMCALTMLAVAAAPGTPKYDGERLFLPLFPFLALLGGSGAVGVIGRLQRLLTGREGRVFTTRRRGARWVALALGLAVVLDGGGAIWRYHPYLLSYYNPLAGGLRGAYESRQYETTYWGEALNDEVIQALNDLPPGTSIKPLALHEKCLEDLQLWGMLDQDLLIGKPKRTTLDGKPVEYYDYHLLLMRQGFFTRPERALAERGVFKGQKWGWGKGAGMVPMIGLYKTGPEFERFWRTVGTE